MTIVGVYLWVIMAPQETRDVNTAGGQSQSERGKQHDALLRNSTQLSMHSAHQSSTLPGLIYSATQRGNEIWTGAIFTQLYGLWCP